MCMSMQYTQPFSYEVGIFTSSWSIGSLMLEIGYLS
jgi:hypothetical protein